MADVDWIIEAIVEEPSAKQALYERLEPFRRPGSVVSSNTSTIPLAHLSSEQPESFQRDLLITHFFNPPRFMRLLEVVAGPMTRPEALERRRRYGIDDGPAIAAALEGGLIDILAGDDAAWLAALVARHRPSI